MTRREGIRIALWTILLLFVLFSITAHPTRGEEQPPQLVMKVVKSEGGTIYVIPEAVVALGLVPESPESRYAPLPPDSIMLCRMHTISLENGHKTVGYRCGLDDYKLQSIAMQPKN